MYVYYIYICIIYLMRESSEGRGSFPCSFITVEKKYPDFGTKFPV